MLLAKLTADTAENAPGAALPPAMPGAVDWNRFIGLCQWPNVVPLVCRALPAVCPGEIPPATLNRL